MEDSNPDIWRYTEEGRKQIKTQIIDFLNNPNSIAFVAEENNRIIGYADGIISRRDTHLPPIVGHIGIIYVEEERRKKGVGTLLVKALYDYFEEKDVEQVNLRHVIGNMEAEKFWSALGFKPVIRTSLVSFQELGKRLKSNV